MRRLNFRLSLAVFIFLTVSGIGLVVLGLVNLHTNLPASNSQVAGIESVASDSNLASASATSSKIPSGTVERGEVSRVIDGDTFEIILRGQKRTVRYIGIDAPETVDPHRPVGCFGHEASQEDKSLIEGRTLTLTSDIEDEDKFGRLLRYAYLEDDNRQTIFVNDYLVRMGFAKAKTFVPNIKYSQQFIDAQTEAQNNKRGLWGRC